MLLKTSYRKLKLVTAFLYATFVRKFFNELKNKWKNALVSPYPPAVCAARGIISRTFHATWPRAPAASCCSRDGPPCVSRRSSACSRWRSSRGHVTPAPRSCAWNTPPAVSWTPCIWKQWIYIKKIFKINAKQHINMN